MTNDSTEFSVPSPKRQRIEESNSADIVDDLDDIYDPLPPATEHVAQSLLNQQSSFANGSTTKSNEMATLPGLGGLMKANAQEMPVQAIITDAIDASAKPILDVRDSHSQVYDGSELKSVTAILESGHTPQIEEVAQEEAPLGSLSEAVKARDTDFKAGQNDEIPLESQDAQVAEDVPNMKVTPDRPLDGLSAAKSHETIVKPKSVDGKLSASDLGQADGVVLQGESYDGLEGMKSGAIGMISENSDQDMLEAFHVKAPRDMPREAASLEKNIGRSEVGADTQTQLETGNCDEPIDATAEQPHETGPLDTVNSAQFAVFHAPEISNMSDVSMDAPLDTALVDGPTFSENAEGKKADPDAEFEIDSSPIESSDSDSSDYTSSSDSGGDNYEMLDPEEQARRLMGEDGASDDEAGGKTSKDNVPLRTVNEKPEEIVPKPNVIVTEDMRIEELGRVENIVENLVLVKAKTSGEYQVLEFGSVLCLEDRSVIGSVAETLGRVQQPYYSVRFTNTAAISEAGLSKDTRVFYVESHSTYIFTQPLKAFKGSDASNIHDEEVGDDELEFSDDEAEAEHKRRTKLQKQVRRDGRDGNNDGFSCGPRGSRGRGWGGGRQRGGPPGRNKESSSGPQHSPVADFPLNYDDGDGVVFEEKSNGDELYTPLARPTNLHEMMGMHEASMETDRHRVDLSRENADRGRGRGRGRIHRGIERGRGREHGSFQAGRNFTGGVQRPQADGFSHPSAPLQHSPSFQNAHQFGHTPTQQSWQDHGSNPYIQSNGNRHAPTYNQQYPQQYQGYTPSMPQQHPGITQYAQPQQQQQHPHYGQSQGYQIPHQPSAYSPTIPPGSHVNPTFFQQQNHNSFPPSWQYGNGYGNNSSSYPQ